MRRWQSVFVLISALSSIVDATCWMINGTDRNSISDPGGDWYQSCDSGIIGNSMCCNLGGDGDVCAPIGNQAQSLCFNQGTDQLWRESCTDKSWESNNCVKLFMNVTNADVLITNCSSRAGYGAGFCYGTGNWGCCSAGQAVFIDPATGDQVNYNPALTTTSTTTSSLTSTSTSTSSSHTTSSTSTSSSPSSSPTGGNITSGLSTGAKAGIGVGVAVGVLLLAGIGIFVFMKRNRKHNDNLPRYSPVAEAGKTEKLELAANPRPLDPVAKNASYRDARTLQQTPIEIGS